MRSPCTATAHPRPDRHSKHRHRAHESVRSRSLRNAHACPARHTGPQPAAGERKRVCHTLFHNVHTQHSTHAYAQLSNAASRRLCLDRAPRAKHSRCSCSSMLAKARQHMHFVCTASVAGATCAGQGRAPRSSPAQGQDHVTGCACSHAGRIAPAGSSGARVTGRPPPATWVERCAPGPHGTPAGTLA